MLHLSNEIDRANVTSGGRSTEALPAQDKQGNRSDTNQFTSKLEFKAIA